MSIQGKRAFLTFLKVFNAIGLVLLIALTFVVLSRISAQAKQTHDDTQASTTRIENDLNCLGRFFNRHNRQNLVINDLNTCSITDTSTGETTVLNGPPKNSQSSSTPTNPVVTQSTPQTVDNSPTPTTSGPPDPGPVKQLTNAVTDIPKDVLKAIGGL